MELIWDNATVESIAVIRSNDECTIVFGVMCPPHRNVEMRNGRHFSDAIQRRGISWLKLISETHTSFRSRCGRWKVDVGEGRVGGTGVGVKSRILKAEKYST